MIGISNGKNRQKFQEERVMATRHKPVIKVPERHSTKERSEEGRK